MQSEKIDTFLVSEKTLQKIAAAKVALDNIRKCVGIDKVNEKKYDDFETWFTQIHRDMLVDEFHEWFFKDIDRTI